DPDVLDLLGRRAVHRVPGRAVAAPRVSRVGALRVRRRARPGRAVRTARRRGRGSRVRRVVLLGVAADDVETADGEGDDQHEDADDDAGHLRAAALPGRRGAERTRLVVRPRRAVGTAVRAAVLGRLAVLTLLGAVLAGLGAVLAGLGAVLAGLGAVLAGLGAVLGRRAVLAVL